MNIVDQTSPPFDSPTGSPQRLLLITLAGIFLAEVIAMIVVYFVEPHPYWLETLLDALIMTALIFPLIYYFSFRSLVNQIEERKRSEALLVNVLETMPVGVWIVDRDGKVLHGNRASLELWAGARYVGMDQYGEYKAWWPATNRPVEADEWAVVRTLATGEAILDEEMNIECFDGTHRVILNSSVPILEQGILQGAIVINQDITERKQNFQALFHSNELLKSVFNSVDILIAHLDKEFNFVQVNDAYARMAGHPAEFLIGKNHFELYPHAENEAIFRQVIETGEPCTVLEKAFEYPEFPERGVTYWNWSLQPICSTGGITQGVVLSLMDVTDRKRAQLQLEQQNHELLRLSAEEHKLRELSQGLVQSTLALNQSQHIEDVLLTVLEQIQRAIPCEMGHIALVEDGELRPVCWLDPAGRSVPYTAQDPPAELAVYPLLVKACAAGQPLLVELAGSSPDWRPLPGIEYPQSFLSAPMRIGDLVVGLINLGSSRPSAFTHESSDRLLAFAAPVSIAVQNLRLYSAEHQARMTAETLRTVSLALTQTLDFDTVTSTLIDHVCRIIPYDSAYVAILQSDSRLALRAISGCGVDENFSRQLDSTFEIWEFAYLETVFTSGQTLLIPDTRRHPGWTIRLEGEQVLSWLGIPILVGDQVFGILALSSTSPGGFSRRQALMVEGIVAQASVAIQNAWLFEQVRGGHERLQSLSRRLVEVQESERRYIARELHDETSQALTALKFGLRLLEKEIDQPEKLLGRVAALKDLTDRVLEDLHHLAVNLRPASLDHLGLASALEQLVKDFGERFDLHTHFKTVGYAEDTRLPDHIETTLYRIAQEALTNAARHARARTVDVILELVEGNAIVMIEDDGIGFETTDIKQPGHLGLLGMQERAQMTGGSLMVESKIGGGTTVVAEVPYADPHFDR